MKAHVMDGKIAIGREESIEGAAKMATPVIINGKGFGSESGEEIVDEGGES